MHLVVVGKALIDGQEERIVIRIDARLQVLHRVRTADHRLIHRTDRNAKNEVGAEIVDTVSTHNPVLGELPLEAEIELLQLGVLHGIVDDVDSRSACDRNDEPGERIRQRRRTWRKHTRGSEVKHVGGAHVSG